LVTGVFHLITTAIGAAPKAAAAGAAAAEGVPKAVSGGPAEALMFYLLAGAIVLSTLGICFSKSIVRMAVWLFFTLGTVAVLYLLLAANFVAAIQLIVYVGGTLVLLIFGVMLTTRSPWVTFQPRRSEVVGATVVGLVLFGVLTTVLTRATWPKQAEEVYGTTVANLGQELLTTYLGPFEAASVLLLLVMVGAAYLARQER